MSIANALAKLPDGTRIALTIGSGDLTVRELRQALSYDDSVREITTGEAATLFGRSREYWASKAAAGKIERAYKDKVGGVWRLPYRACVEHVARRRRAVNRPGRKRKRGPWSAAPSSTPRAGTEDLPRKGLKVVAGGSQAVGQGTGGDAQPEGSRMAGRGRTDGSRGDR